MRRPGLASLSLAGVLLAASAATAGGGAADLLYERTVMSAADDRCGLFAPDLGSALDAARLQARGAALRSGTSDARVTAIERQARARAATVACASPDVSTAAARVRDAFEGWREVGRMDFPGERQGWIADRASSREPAWRLRQDARVGFERATLGIGGTHTASAMVATVEGPPPASARLLARHLIRSPRPLTAGALSTRGPRGSGARVFLAEARTPAPVGLRSGSARATTFRFPAAAVEALSGLDARESVAVEFADAQGRVHTAWFEVGDFAAGRAFLAAGRR